MQSSSKPENSVMCVLGRVHADSVNHDVRQFTICLYNSVDILKHVNGEFNDENTPGYLETEGLEEILENIRAHLTICYHHKRITVMVKEEEST